jgi:hypothetical protein
MKTPILRRRIKVSGTGGRVQANFFSHPGNPSLNFLATFAEVFQNLLNTELVDGTEALTRNSEPYETALALQPESVRMQVRQEASTRLILCVGNVIS